MPPDEQVDLTHQPAVAMFLIVVIAAGVFMVVINLRNARLWLLRLRGRRATAVVEAIEVVRGPDGEVLRRPRVVFTTDRGERVVGTPAVYRKTTTLATGGTAMVSYAAGNPARMVVHGFDFRRSEPVYALIGVAIAIGISVLYFRL